MFYKYTVNHKKRATLFLTITLAFIYIFIHHNYGSTTKTKNKQIYSKRLKKTRAFVGLFLYFLYQWKQEGILHKQLNKICHFTLTVSPHYLVKLKRRIS